MLKDKRILLVIAGGIAAYKSLSLIRLLRQDGAEVRCILTQGGAQFITPLSVSALSEAPCYTDLFSLKDETEMGHIRLSRECDLIVVAPASANLMAGLTHGLAHDLATTTLLAADKPVMICPAMNPMMWNNPATKDNVRILKERSFHFCGPDNGAMACGETGEGRMAEPEVILGHIRSLLSTEKPLRGLRALVTAGPTYEPLDPVRFIGNRSSGKQGYAIAEALAREGAEVTLVSGPTSLTSPQNINTIRCETAEEMLKICDNQLPADIAVMCAAVADWRADAIAAQKVKKTKDAAPTLSLRPNPDILKTIAMHLKCRPSLVIGFAAETENVVDNARRKLETKRCDWIVCNDVSGGQVFGKDQNQVTLVTPDRQDAWPSLTKTEVAHRLVEDIVTYFDHQPIRNAAE